MQHRLIQSVGIAWTLLFAAFIIWVYATEPRNVKGETAAPAAAAPARTNETAQDRFNRALAMFRRGEYRAAREEWDRSDPNRADARTQFYIAYAFYREGWGPFGYDKDLFRQGIDAAERAIELAPEAIFTSEDPDLLRYAATGLKAEIQQGLERTDFDINPFRTHP